MENDQYESLFRCSENDFEVWKSKKYGHTHYHVSIEGYIGYEKLEMFIPLYESFLNHLHKYLIDNNYDRTERCGWKRIYQTRAIKICHDHGCYWIFLDTYRSSHIWDLYYYMEDIIGQLKSDAIPVARSRDVGK